MFQLVVFARFVRSYFCEPSKERCVRVVGLKQKLLIQNNTLYGNLANVTIAGVGTLISKIPEER